MSALSKLVGKPEPWKWFTEKYPVKVKQVNPPTSFTKTIKENILFPRPEASENELLEAVEGAFVNEFTDYDFEGSGFAVLLDLLAYNYSPLKD